MAVINTGNFAKALKPQVQAWFGDLYKDHPTLYSQYMDVVQSMDKYEEDVLMSGLGLATIKAEGAASNYDDSSQGYTKRYDHIMYSNGFVITREMIEDGKAPARAERFTKSLKNGMMKTQETVAANVLNRAFNNSYLGGDGIELCASNHPTLGANLRNELATPADLSEAALEQALIDIYDMKDHRGLRINVQARKLVIPNALAFEAQRILRSELRVGTADNDINALRSMSILPEGYVRNPYLTDSDAYFIITDVDNGLKFIERTGMQVEDDNDFDTFNAKFLASMRFSVGWTDPRGVFGSEGA